MRKTVLVLVALLVLGLAACSGKYKPETGGAGAGNGTASETGAAGETGTGGIPADCEDQTGGDATVTMSGFAFVPKCLRVSAGSKLTIVNEDQSAHSFTVQGSDVGETLDVGDTVEIDPLGLEPGTYSFNCNFHPPMVGTLVVE